MDAEKAMVQQRPPAQFNKFKKSPGASPVTGLITRIIEDSKQVEDVPVSGEGKPKQLAELSDDDGEDNGDRGCGG